MGKDLFFIETKGYSMYPFLNGGSRVLVKKVDFNALKIGDIIVYKSNGQMICHRIIKKSKENDGNIIYASGDASKGFGERVLKDMFIGKVFGIVRGNRVIKISGKWREFINLLIVNFGYYINLLIRAIKKPLRPLYHYFLQYYSKKHNNL